MEFRNRIQGDKVVSLLRELQQQRTPLRFRMPGRKYDRLTIVTGVESRNGRSFLLVDVPGGFEEERGKEEGARVHIEFADKDRIPHSCRTVIDHVEREDLWLVLPEFLERVQRRRYFRVEPPAGTRILFPLGGKPIEVPVLNISLGGTLIISPGKDLRGVLPLQVGTRLSDVRLMGKVDGKGVDIRIQKAEVRRVDAATENRRTLFGVQFLLMEKPDEQALERFIYDCQRRLLKKRSMLLEE